MGGYTRGMPVYGNRFPDSGVVRKSSWLSYEFHVYAPNGSCIELPGVYIFCGAERLFGSKPLYVGETYSFRNRLTPSHEMWGPACSMGMTEIHTRMVLDAADRLVVEKELIQALQPPLNKSDRNSELADLLLGTNPYRRIR